MFGKRSYFPWLAVALFLGRNSADLMLSSLGDEHLSEEEGVCSGDHRGNETASQDPWTSNYMDSESTFAKQPVSERQTTGFKIREHIKKNQATLSSMGIYATYTQCKL